MTFIAIDPGGTTGWAIFDNAGGLLSFGQGNKDELYMVLKNPYDVYIVEDYRVFKHVDHTGSKVETTRIIGAIDMIASQNGKKVVFQSVDNREIGYKWGKQFGLAKAKSHAQSHQLDAIAHGYYYLIKNKIL